MQERPTRWRCDVCDRRMFASEFIRHELPPHRSGCPSIAVSQCPDCGAVEQFTNVCDEPGCMKDAGCGWPSPDGYRRTCGDHWKRN